MSILHQNITSSVSLMIQVVIPLMNEECPAVLYVYNAINRMASIILYNCYEHGVNVV